MAEADLGNVLNKHCLKEIGDKNIQITPGPLCAYIEFINLNIEQQEIFSPVKIQSQVTINPIMQSLGITGDLGQLDNQIREFKLEKKYVANQIKMKEKYLAKELVEKLANIDQQINKLNQALDKKQQEIQLNQQNNLQHIPTLVIQVLEAINLEISDVTDLPDCYVLIEFDQNQEQKTNVIRETLNPKWYEDIIFQIEDYNTQKNPEILIELYDWKRKSQDQILGREKFQISKFMNQKNQDIWIDLKMMLGKRKKGNESKLQKNIFGQVQSDQQGQLHIRIQFIYSKELLLNNELQEINDEIEQCRIDQLITKSHKREEKQNIYMLQRRKNQISSDLKILKEQQKLARQALTDKGKGKNALAQTTFMSVSNKLSFYQQPQNRADGKLKIEVTNFQQIQENEYFNEDKINDSNQAEQNLSQVEESDVKIKIEENNYSQEQQQENNIIEDDDDDTLRPEIETWWNQ